MESISEWRSNIVVEKKRLYESEDQPPTPTPLSPSSLQQQQQQQFSLSHPHNPSSSTSSASSSISSPTSASSSSSSSSSSYPAWKQKRKQAHNDINNLAASLDDNNILTTTDNPNTLLSRSPNATVDANSNDSFRNSNLLQTPDNMSPISISSAAANADGSSASNGGEKLIDDDRLIPVHDNPFFVKDGKKLVVQRFDKKDSSGQLDCPNDCNNINNRFDFPNSLDDTDMEYRPGSGFVSRLKDKFASMSTKEDVTVLRPKRSSSVENLLDGRPKSHPFNGGDLRLTDTRRKLREARAVSVENLNHTMEKSSPTSPLTLEPKSEKDMLKSNDLESSCLPDRNIVIVEKTPTPSLPLSPSSAKPLIFSAASIEEQSVDDELPKPNTVSSFRSLFENSKSNNNNEVSSRAKGKAPIASSPKVVSSASSDSLSSLSSLASSSTTTSERIKSDGSSITVNHVHDKGKKSEGSVRKAEVTKPSSLDQLVNSSSKDILSPKTSNTPASIMTPNSLSAPSKSPSLDRLSPANNMADSMKLNLSPRGDNNDKLLDSESKENAEQPSMESKTIEINELNNRGLPSILMRKGNSDSGELGQVILRKTSNRSLEDDDELKGRITYYPAGLNKSNNAVSSNYYPTPKKRQAPKAPTPDSKDSKTLQGELDIMDYTLENERVTINDISPDKKTGTFEPLTPLDLSSITNNDVAEYQEGYIPTKIGPCKIKFIGADVKLDRSCIVKSKTKKHKVCFCDPLKTLHDYPSEEVMLEDYLEKHPEERHLQLLDGHGVTEGNAESTDDGSESDDNSPSFHDGRMSNMALSSSGGLSTYRSKYQMDFEFGMQLEENPPPPVEQVPNETDLDMMQLRPADEKDLNSWSESSSADILF